MVECRLGLYPTKVSDETVITYFENIISRDGNPRNPIYLITPSRKLLEIFINKQYEIRGSIEETLKSYIEHHPTDEIMVVIGPESEQKKLTEILEELGIKHDLLYLNSGILKKGSEESKAGRSAFEALFNKKR